MRRGGTRRALIIASLAAALVGRSALAETLLDDFESLAGWTATASDPGVKVELASDAGQTGMAMRIDFDFAASGGHVLVRKPFAVDLPSNYAFTYAWRAQAPPIDFEFKLIDRSERNVWWYRRPDVTLPTDWTTVRIKKPRLAFAWGPLGGGAPRNIAYIELAITGAVGDRGSLWIDDLRLEPRPPPERAPAKPTVSASTSLAGHEPSAVLDDDPYTSWQSGALAPEQWLQLDFGKPREYAGLVVDWGSQDYAVAYDVEVSDDGQTWTTAYQSTRGNGHRDHIFLPDGESRYLRLALHQSSRGQGYEIRALRIIPLELAASPNQFVEGIAREARPGTYPRYFSGQQSYWTVVGVNGDDKKALLGDDGMLEIDAGGFSIMPFLYADGALASWNTVERSQSLEDGYLPIPSVTWTYGSLSMEVTALASGAPGASVLLARYAVVNRAEAGRDVTLYLAVWPFQVLPPWQTLNIVGGVAPIRDMLFDTRTLWVNGRTPIIALTPPTHVGAATGDEGAIGDFLNNGELPERMQVSDPAGFASGALAFDLHLPAGGQQAVYIAVPFHDPDPLLARASGAGAEAEFARAFDAAKREWGQLLNRVEFNVPAAAADLVQTMKTTLAYILIERGGPAIQPGPRTYARSWIRDGAMISAALLEMGFPQEGRDFLRWYAGYQYGDGRIPCCVDRHGADPLSEYDSNGEFLYALGEYYRYTHDIGFLYEMWPTVQQAVRFLESLRAQRLTEAYMKPSTRAYYGLLVESVSHEGYLSHPVHSYWDDFFAVRGLKDAVIIATALGEDAEAARFAALRDGLQHDLEASIAAVIAERKLDYIPASVELGDFDPSSTAVGIAPGGELARLPQPQLTQTFERYYDEFVRRRQGDTDWDAYSPYELRNVGALLRLGRREQALDVLEGLLADRRPLAWNEWPEVIWRDPAAPKFIGDMPHAWVGAGYIEAVRDLFAYERDDDGALVVGAGIPAAWMAGDDVVGVRRLPTHYGILSYSLHREGPSTLRLRLSGDLRVPPGGIVVVPPLGGPLTTVTVNGEAVDHEADRVRVDRFPADVTLEY
jgi:GH15 family glucan-1,4-alpha-glucosidase